MNPGDDELNPAIKISEWSRRWWFSHDKNILLLRTMTIAVAIGDDDDNSGSDVVSAVSSSVGAGCSSAWLYGTQLLSGDGGHFHSHRCMTESRARKYLLPERVSLGKEKGDRIRGMEGIEGRRERDRERERKREEKEGREEHKETWQTNKRNDKTV